MYKISVKIVLPDRLVVKRAHPFLSIIYFSIFLSSLLLSSCATRRDVITHSVVSDTTHVTVTDTTHIVSVRDSTILSEREVIHERIVTIYDRDTGRPIEQTTDRNITRQRDSLVTHLRDSILHALQLEAMKAHADSLHHEQHRATGSATLTTAQYTMRLIVVWILFIGMIAFLVYALRSRP